MFAISKRSTIIETIAIEVLLCLVCLLFLKFSLNYMLGCHQGGRSSDTNSFEPNNFSTNVMKSKKLKSNRTVSMGQQSQHMLHAVRKMQWQNVKSIMRARAGIL
uniref:Putative ovule protein n=1 Tax=Solanum chacoense TaxID=4108 RepID=A0A0V0HHW2_SOLCH